MEKLKKKQLKKPHNFKIPRAHVYPQTTSKMPVKFQSICLKLWEELCSQGTYYTYTFIVLKYEKKSKLKMWKNWKKIT